MAVKNFMERHHSRIIDLLETYEATPTPDKKLHLRWEVERHFLAEEKEIFTKCPSGNRMIERILKEHREILALLDGDDIAQLRNRLVAHQQFEDDLFYPSLQGIMSDEQINELYEKLHTEM